MAKVAGLEDDQVILMKRLKCCLTIKSGRILDYNVGFPGDGDKPDGEHDDGGGGGGEGEADGQPLQLHHRRHRGQPHQQEVLKGPRPSHPEGHRLRWVATNSINIISKA